MTLLLENPLPIWAAGVVLTAIGIVVVMAKRSLGSVVGMAVVVGVTLLLLLVEHWVVTESEEVEQAVADLLTAIEANDLPAVLALIDSSAQSVQSDTNTMMPLVKVRETGHSALRVEVDVSSNPHRATAFFRGRIDGTHARSGTRMFYYDQVEIDWVKRGDDWRIVSYRASVRGKPINAVESMRANRVLRRRRGGR